jgi:hypothetical protein
MYPERRPLILLLRSLWSPESCLQNAPSLPGKTRHRPLTQTSCFWLRKRPSATLLDWRLQVSGPRSLWPRPCVRCLRQTSIRVGAHLCLFGQQAEAPQSVFAHWRSAEAWYRDDPSVTRLPLGKPVYVSIARTSPRRDVTVVSLVSLCLSSCCCVLNFVCLGKRSRLCRRATDEEYPGRRRTKGARRRRQPSPAPSFLLPSVQLPCPPTYLQAADFFPFFLINLDCHSTNLAPAGISPRSRYFHRAINSLRATATMPIFRAGPLPVPNRRAYH